MKKKLIIAVSSVIIITLTLITDFSSGKVNSVRADGTCCKETGSICVTNAGSFNNYYFKTEGPCKVVQID